MNDFSGSPLIEHPNLELAKKHIPAEFHDIATQLFENGYAIIDFPDSEIVDRSNRIIKSLQPKFDLEFWKNNQWARGESLRITDGWIDNQDIREIAINESILQMLSQLYGRPAFPFQTLNFPVGTQQNVHSDTMHFNSIPERWMCGVWLALEDIDKDNGPLIYYPGTHRWPILWGEHLGLNLAHTSAPGQHLFDPHWQKQIRASKIQPQTLRCKKGQAVIWMANLLHGGGKQIDKNRTRWTQVTHYYFENCAYWRPYASNLSTGEIFSFTPPNISTGTGYAASESTKAKTPSDFDPKRYIALNPDLHALSEAHAVEHWILNGIHERRIYK